MTSPLFDLEPHGTPCLVCDESPCLCRATGALEATAPAPFIPGDTATARAERPTLTPTIDQPQIGA